MPTNGWNEGDRGALAKPPEQVDTYKDTHEEAGQPGVGEAPKAKREEARARTPQPHSEDIRKIQVDDEDRLAFRVGVNALTLILLGFGIWFLITYVF